MQKLPKSLTVWWRWLLLAALALTGLPASAAPAGAVSPANRPAAAAAPAANGTLTLSVVSARNEPDHTNLDGSPAPVLKGQAVTTYKYLINEDNVGDPTQPRFPDCSPFFEDPARPGKPDLNSPNLEYPDKCNWPSLRAMPGGAPIETQGDQDDFNGVIGTGISLPPGKYLISVLADTLQDRRAALHRAAGRRQRAGHGGTAAAPAAARHHAHLCLRRQLADQRRLRCAG